MRALDFLRQINHLRWFDKHAAAVLKELLMRHSVLSIVALPEEQTPGYTGRFFLVSAICNC